MRMDWLVKTALVVAAIGHAQAAVKDRPYIAGPWEATGATGIDGIYFRIGTGSHQTVDVRVFHREEGKETWGWFRPSDDIHDDGLIFAFNGKRLRIRFTNVAGGERLDLDVTFSPKARTWTGSISRDGRMRPIVFSRPHPRDAQALNAFVGDWTGEGAPIPHFAPTRLHISESSDGVLSAWLDRTFDFDQRDGELLRVISAMNSELVVETNNPGGLTYRFRGRLSDDGQSLTGQWKSDLGTGNTLHAAATFRR